MTVADVLRALATSTDALELEKVIAAAGLDDAVDAAMDVFNVLAHLRRRQRELTGLYATARELTTVRAIDEVLQSIAERAHDLVPSADASYIAVREEDGGFRVRASIGLTSPAFKQVHTRPGTGMAAKIVRTGSSLWIRRYADSDTIVHEKWLDAALAEEELVSVLGVPLKIRNEVIGILYAANRFERPLSAEECALLEAFADHAAIALENARLFGQLDAARCAAEEDAETIRRAAKLHDRLTKLVLEGADVDEVMREISVVFKGNVRLLQPEAQEFQEAIAESWRNGHSVATDGGYVTALGAGGARLGALVLETDTLLSAPDMRNLETTAHILSLLVFRQQAIVEAEERVHGQLFRELATGGTLREHQRLLARARGFDPGGSFVAVFARRESGRPADLAWAMSSLARSHAGLGGEHGSGAGAFLPGTDAEKLARFVHDRLKQELRGGLIVCAAEPQQPVAPDAQMRLAERSAALLHSLGRVDAAVSAHELGLYSILFNPERSGELAAFLHATIGLLCEHDATHGTALLDTVHAYFREGGNLARTARALYVHPNTVVKRLARVAALLGDDWQSPDRALELHMALQLRWLANRVLSHSRGSASTGHELASIASVRCYAPPEVVECDAVVERGAVDHLAVAQPHHPDVGVVVASAVIGEPADGHERHVQRHGARTPDIRQQGGEVVVVSHQNLLLLTISELMDPSLGRPAGPPG